MLEAVRQLSGKVPAIETQRSVCEPERRGGCGVEGQRDRFNSRGKL